MFDLAISPGPWKARKPIGGYSTTLIEIVDKDYQKVMDFGDETDFYPTEGTPPIGNNLTGVLLVPQMYDVVQAAKMLMSNLPRNNEGEISINTDETSDATWLFFRHAANLNISIGDLMSSMEKLKGIQLKKFAVASCNIESMAFSISVNDAYSETQAIIKHLKESYDINEEVLSEKEEYLKFQKRDYEREYTFSDLLYEHFDLTVLIKEIV